MLASHTMSAQAKTLSEQSIKSFIEKTTRLTSGSIDNDATPDDVIDYLDKHIEDEARFKTLMRFDIPGHPPQESAMKMDKGEFIEKIKNGTRDIDDYESSIEILNINMSRDKRTATVQTRNDETAMVPIQNGEGGVETIPMDGTSLCTQIIRMSKRDVIQMYNASCVTDIMFTSFGDGNF